MVADIALCRHSASVCSFPVVLGTWSASAAANGPNSARCCLSSSRGSAPARLPQCELHQQLRPDVPAMHNPARAAARDGDRLLLAKHR